MVYMSREAVWAPRTLGVSNMGVSEQNGILVVGGTAKLDEAVLESAVYAVRCAHHKECGGRQDGGYRYPSLRPGRNDRRCAFCMKVENTQRPARVYVASRMVTYRLVHHDPYIGRIRQFLIDAGIACTEPEENGICGRPVRRRSAAGLRCHKHSRRGKL